MSNLKEKYGEPDPDSPGMIKFADDKTLKLSGEATSIELGYIEYIYKWTTDNSVIVIGISSADYEVSVALSYDEKSYFEDDSDDNSGF